MYLALKQPWQRAALAVEPEEAEVAPAREEPEKKPGRKRRAGKGGGARPDLDDRTEADFEETPPPVELTAADRKLVWRGPELVLPPARVDLTEGADSGRALSDGEIGGVVREQGRGVIDCMVTAATGTNLRATVTLRLLVDGNGQVTRHRMQAPQYLLDHGMPACVDRAVGRMRFPATGAFTLVTAPFELG
jgi:hypothetical protein